MRVIRIPAYVLAYIIAYGLFVLVSNLGKDTGDTIAISAVAVLASENAVKSRADSLGAPPQAQSGAEAAEILSAADVIILGEVHDNAHHHQVQAELVTMLRPKALVWEMITQDQAERLTPQILQDAGETVRRIGEVTAGQGVHYSGSLL